MYRITECKEKCNCTECKDSSCAWNGTDQDKFILTNHHGSIEIYSNDDYLETPIPAFEIPDPE